MDEIPKLTFFDDFPPSSVDAWRDVVGRDLKGAAFDKRLVSRSEDGIRVEPLYTAADAVDAQQLGFPGAPPYTRGGRPLADGASVQERIEHPDLSLAAAQAREALGRGADALWIRLDARGRAGRDWDQVGDLPPSGAAGVMLAQLSELAQLLEGVDLAAVPLALDAGASALPLGAMLIALCRQRGIEPARLRGSLDADPLGALAADGRLPSGLDVAFDQLAEVAGWLTEHAPGVRGVTISTLPYHEAGASPAQELAFALATGVAYLRRLTAAGLALEPACKQLLFRLAVGRDVFAETAKLRAARLCWSRVVQACGAPAASGQMVLHASTSWRTKTRFDPWVNMLRGTVESFAALVGGADQLSVSCFDETIGASTEFSQRIARNTQIILGEEAYVGRVTDPAGGSWYVESLTQKLAEAAWSLFQQIEREGGMADALLQGRIQQLIAETAGKRQQAIDRRKLPITGVSEFPHVHEEPVERRGPDLTALRERGQRELAAQLDRVDPKQATAALTAEVGRAGRPLGALMSVAIESATAGATLGRLAGALAPAHSSALVLTAPLQRCRDAEGFERLRLASDADADVRGGRPKAFLANMGPIPQHRARAEFSSNLLQAGGFEPQTNDGFESVEMAARAFSQSKARLAVICSTDEDYRERAGELARALKERGAQLVVLAGRPGDDEGSYRAAGVDHFIFLGCDVRATLSTLLQQLEVIQ